MKKSLLVTLFGSALLSGCSSPLTKEPSLQTNTYAYGTKSVYSPQEALINYSAIPTGYSLVYTELVSRHGSRALSKPKYDYISLQIWNTAKAQHALTPLGEKLGPEIERLMAANQKMGYGNLSALGKEELTHMGERLAVRDKILFDRAVKEHRDIAFEYSGVQRAKDSGLAFVSGLENKDPALSQLVLPVKANKAELYFHKQKNNKDYQQYKAHDPQLLTAIDKLMNQPKTHKMAQQMLERIYTPTFVHQLTQGDLAFTQKGKHKPTVYNDVDAAIQLFNLYLVSPGLSMEAGSQPWKFKEFITPQESQWFTYVLDGKDFYEKGPSFSHTNITYHMAKALEEDFFNEVRGIKEGTNTKAAKIRFAHAETIMPFAAQMQLEGSTQSMPVSQEYTQDNNPWRGQWVSPYSANIQWDVYQNQDGKLLVKMLYNEKEIAFKKGCQAISKGSYFYRFSELTRCYQE